MKFLTIIIICLNFCAHAHQPKLINYSPTTDSPHRVIEPEVSKAYYGKLKGSAHYYEIISYDDFLFYVGILTPKIDQIHKPFSISVFDQYSNIIYQANGPDFVWKEWYEPYAKDWYWKGPEIGKDTNKEFKTSFLIKKGVYLIKVYNEDNYGSYSLAVGEEEFFGSNLFEKILTWIPIIIYIGPYLDFFYWHKLDIRAFMPHFFLFIIFFLFYIILKKFFFKKKRRYFEK